MFCVKKGLQIAATETSVPMLLPTLAWWRATSITAVSANAIWLMLPDRRQAGRHVEVRTDTDQRPCRSW